LSQSISTRDEQQIDAGKLKVVPLRHPLRWAAVACALLLLAMVLSGLARNHRFQWSVVAEYLFAPPILKGILLTIELTLIAMTIGIVLGTVLAFMRLSNSPFLTAVAWGYSWVFRSIPVLVQLLFWYNLAALYPTVSLGIPFGPRFVSADANDVITPLTAAILGLGLAQAAYTSEVIRGGMLSVGRGQSEAALSLGMRTRQRLFRIILPQAMRPILPPVGNEFIGMLKNTSLVSVIALADLLFTAQVIYARTFQTIPLIVVVCLWYLILTTVLSIGQYFLEKRYSRGT